MSRFQVTPEALQATAQELQAMNDQFCQRIRNLIEKQQELSSMWQGDANSAFTAAFNHDAVKWDAFATLISAYISTLTQIAQLYQRVEQQNAAIASGRSYGGGVPANIASVLTIPNIMVMYASPKPNFTQIGTELGGLESYLSLQG